MREREAWEKPGAGHRAGGAAATRAGGGAQMAEMDAAQERV